MLAATPAVLPPDYRPDDTSVLVTTGWVWPLRLELDGRTYNPHPRWALMEPWNVTPEQGNAYRWVLVESGTRPPDWLDVTHARVAGRWRRPDGGEVTTLYDRGTVASRAAAAR